MFRVKFDPCTTCSTSLMLKTILAVLVSVNSTRSLESSPMTGMCTFKPVIGRSSVTVSRIWKSLTISPEKTICRSKMNIFNHILAKQNIWKIQNTCFVYLDKHSGCVCICSWSVPQHTRRPGSEPPHPRVSCE